MVGGPPLIVSYWKELKEKVVLETKSGGKCYQCFQKLEC
jgi:ABC-type thiamine transport system substrate-binding protein